VNPEDALPIFLAEVLPNRTDTRQGGATMKNIARALATTALVGFAVLTAGGIAQAQSGPNTDWPFTAAASAPASDISWSVAPHTDWP
jgi:hypothetical protein